MHGNQRGRAMGYPTANLDPACEGFVPADGVYAARVLHDGTVYPAAVSVGNNPTFEGVPAKQIEAHLLDVDIDLYGDRISVLFVSYVRGMVKFSSMDEPRRADAAGRPRHPAAARTARAGLTC